MNMNRPDSRSLWLRRLLLPTAVFFVGANFTVAAMPGAGDMAPNFTLRTLDDKPVALKALTDAGPVVLVVLRGWPEYQCPVCTRQVQDYIANAAQFAGRGARVLMVYPGPADQLKAHAQEFLQNKTWPADFLFVIDPDYAFTNA